MEQLAQDFAEYFDNKVGTLRHALDAKQQSPCSDSVLIGESCSSSFTKFLPMTEDEVLEIIKGSKIKSCSLDPIPACLTADNLDLLLPHTTAITNMSLEMGVFPDAFKSALVTPILKKLSLDPEIMKNYRPISNLAFLGKTIERCAMKQFVEYLSSNNLFAPSQSAYRQCFSIETALTRVYNDILMDLDKQGGETILVLLDLTAAFDTIDHEVFIDRLQSRYGVGGSALDWFSSYLHNRSQSVLVDDVSSRPVKLDYGVPQGSVCGPICFILYTAPLENIITAHGLSCMKYADDSQLYINFNAKNQQSALGKIENCITDIKSWMSSNFLVLNDSKTEIIHFTSRFAKPRQLPLINIGEAAVKPTPQVRDLGAIFDEHLKMDQHVNNLCRGATFALSKIGKLRKYLDPDTTHKLIQAFVICRLDNCNSLLYGLPQKDINKLHRIQNMAARLIFLTKKRDHITPILRDQLHWLPVEQRIHFKIILLTYKVFHGIAPAYLSALISPYTPSRGLRAGNVRPEGNLQIVRSRTKTYGERAFAFAAPVLWNALPEHIRKSPTVAQFKAQLKTHLFKNAFHV